MNPHKKLLFGLIGCGEIGLQNAQAIVEAEKAELMMCADINLEMARDLGKRYHIPHTSESGQVFSSTEVDAVFICTPPFTHAPLTIEAARHGKHVVTEKPMSVTLAEADQMIAACQATGVKLAVCFCLRYRAEIQQAKALVEKGILGKVLGVQITFHHDREETYWTGGHSGRVRTDWRGDPKKSGGGVLVANVLHYLDLVRYLTGLGVRQVCNQYATLSIPVMVEDSLSLTCVYENGAIGNVSASMCVLGTEYLFDFRIWGTEGHLSLASPMRFYSLRTVDGYAPGRWHRIKGKGIDERTAFVDRFVESVLDDGPLPASGEDGRAMQAIIQAAYTSGHTGKVTEVL